MEYVTQNADAFRAMDRVFPTFLAAYVSSDDQKLGRRDQDRINNEYMRIKNNAQQGTIDPYRLACYKVIGRCELSVKRLENIGQGVEDWMWLQFSLAREVNRAEELATEVFGLDEVRRNIRDIGQQYFARGSEGATQGYGTFFYLQILGGLFEHAVSYLYDYNVVAAVHFAIALDYYGLMRVSGYAVNENELRELHPAKSTHSSSY